MVGQVLPGVEVTAVYSPHRLVESLVDDPALVGTAINLTAVTDEWRELLRSIARAFPVLPTLVVLAPGAGSCPEGIQCVQDDVENDEFRRTFEKVFGAGQPRDRRTHHRFEWPLQVRFSDGDRTVHRISQISAGGAYLEPVSHPLDTGEVLEMEIHFQNFMMRARCEILDPRMSSSRRSAGFGVRFLELSADGAAFVDRIVNDALAAVLLDADARPSVPTIDEEEDILSIGGEFSLT